MYRPTMTEHRLSPHDAALNEIVLQWQRTITYSRALWDTIDHLSGVEGLVKEISEHSERVFALTGPKLSRYGCLTEQILLAIRLTPGIIRADLVQSIVADLPIGLGGEHPLKTVDQSVRNLERSGRLYRVGKSCFLPERA